VIRAKFGTADSNEGILDLLLR